MSRKLLVSILIASAVVILLAVVIVVIRPEPARPRPVPKIGSIRDLKPVALPATAPDMRPPKTEASVDAASDPKNGK